MIGSIFKISIGVACLFGFTATNTEIKNDLQQMNMVYRDSKNISIQVNVKMVTDRNGKSSSYKGILKKGADVFYSSLMGKQMIADKEHLIVVDEKNKAIYVRNRSDVKKEEMSAFNQLDSSWFASSKLRYLVNNQKEKRIGIDAKENGYARCEIAIDAKTKMLTQVFFEYLNVGVGGLYQMCADYTTDTKTKITEKTCPECRLGNYVSIKGRKVLPNEKYKNYTVYDKRR